MSSIANSAYLVTGATDGIGKALALALAQQDATVILHGRSEAKLSAAEAKIRAASGNEKLFTVQADFSSLSQVVGMAEEVSARFPALNVLINNAGHLTDHHLLVPRLRRPPVGDTACRARVPRAKSQA